MLPGKLCIGILEEDNPLKSYFRIKPLLVESEGRYLPFDGAEKYPDDGCLRIVPDKNESGYFKLRMRRMGRFCVLDLREHSGENDKIRLNKNYKNDDGERNSCIIYSDVVCEPADNLIFEICENISENGLTEIPSTRRLADENLDTWLYLPGENGAIGSAERDGARLREEEVQRFELQGFSGMLRFAIRLPASASALIQSPQARMEAARLEAARIEPLSQPQPDKPWLCRVPGSDMRPASMTGLNPRRSQSLKEIIEEKWRHSRVDQLGHPVPAYAMGKPVENPVDSAVDSLKNVWRKVELRPELLERIAEMQGFSAAMEELRSVLKNSAISHELEELEAERLKTIDDIDRFKRDKQLLREEFKREIRTEEAEAFREATQNTKRAQAEYEKYRAMADEARQTAEQAQDAYRSLGDGRFERELLQFALCSRAAKLFSEDAQADAVLPPVSDDMPNREAWIARMTAAFASLGLTIDRLQAANLLVSIAACGKILLSGAASSDKRLAAKAIARALGAESAGCYAVRDDGTCKPFRSEAIAVTLAQGFNAKDYPLPRCEDNHVLLMELYDLGAGHPVDAELLENCLLLRLQPQSADSPWQCAKNVDSNYFPVRMDALRSAFLSDDATLPEALHQKLQKLREVLKGYGVYLSRTTLDLLWRCCSALIAAKAASPEEAFDLVFAQRALPCVLAQAPLECQAQLPHILTGMSRCLALLNELPPIQI